MLIPRPAWTSAVFKKESHYSSQERVSVLLWPARMFADLGLPPWTSGIECLKIPEAEGRGNWKEAEIWEGAGWAPRRWAEEKAGHLQCPGVQNSWRLTLVGAQQDSSTRWACHVCNRVSWQPRGHAFHSNQNFLCRKQKNMRSPTTSFLTLTSLLLCISHLPRLKMRMLKQGQP